MTSADKANILVVDDAEEIRSIVKMLLEGAGHEVKEASDGIEALESVAAGAPDLILLDIAMPRLDGLETCRRLKASADTRDIPVVFLTSHSGLEEITTCFELGAVDFVKKPVSGAELLARIRTHVQLRRATLKLSQLAEELSQHLSPEVYASMFNEVH
jgi:CheY-like chemotaxis protein